MLKEKEIRLFGEYRTARLVLAAWDRFTADGTFAGWAAADAQAPRAPATPTIKITPNAEGIYAVPNGVGSMIISAKPVAPG